MVYVRDEDKSGSARTRGVTDECPDQIGEKIKIRGKKRQPTGGSRGRPRKTTSASSSTSTTMTTTNSLFDDESDEDLDAIDGVPDVEGVGEEEEECRRGRKSRSGNTTNLPLGSPNSPRKMALKGEGEEE